MGCTFSGCYIGYQDRVVLVDEAFSGNDISFHGNRLGGVPGSGVTEPNQYSTFLFGLNSTDGTSTLGMGPHASRAMSLYDPVLSGLTIGAAGSRVTKMTSVIYTANFGTVSAGSTVAMNFSYSGVDPTYSALSATMSHSLGSKAGIVYSWWIGGFGTICGSATNVSGADIASVNGGVRFTVWTHTSI
jgi:hypothetical protein